MVESWWKMGQEYSPRVSFYGDSVSPCEGLRVNRRRLLSFEFHGRPSYVCTMRFHFNEETLALSVDLLWTFTWKKFFFCTAFRFFFFFSEMAFNENRGKLCESVSQILHLFFHIATWIVNKYKYYKYSF